MKVQNILLVGYGNMGKIHKRIIQENNKSNLYGIIDTSFKINHETKDGIQYFNNFDLLNLENGEIDAVIISSTTSSHFQIAEKFIHKKIPVLLEKPISNNQDEIKRLLDLASNLESVFRCGLIEIYNPIFKYIKLLQLDNIISIHIYRHSQKIAENRKLDDVLLDLTLHDISVIGYLFDSPKLNLVGHNFNSVNNIIESADLLYDFGKTNLFISSSRQSQLKVRKWDILTEDKLYQIDLVTKNIDIYESGKINNPDQKILSSNSSLSSMSFANYVETAQIQLNEFIKNIEIGIQDEYHIEIVKFSHNLIMSIYDKESY